MKGGLHGRTVLLSGGSRGIGLAIALRAARDGANVAILAKTTDPHPKLEGTIFTAAAAIEAAGGQALAVACDVRSEDAVAAAVQQTVQRFGAIDIVVNNASAIDLSGSEALATKRYDLMQDINVRGTFLLSRACTPHLRKSGNPHVLTLSPPLDLEPEWFGRHVAYTVSKYAMSMGTLRVVWDHCVRISVGDGLLGKALARNRDAREVAKHDLALALGERLGDRVGLGDNRRVLVAEVLQGCRVGADHNLPLVPRMRRPRDMSATMEPLKK